MLMDNCGNLPFSFLVQKTTQKRRNSPRNKRVASLLPSPMKRKELDAHSNHSYATCLFQHIELDFNFINANLFC